MKTALLLFVLLTVAPLLHAQTDAGPADTLWDLYQQGAFEEVAKQGRALIATDNGTAQVNLAVGRALVDMQRYEEGLPYLLKAAEGDPDRTWVFAWAQVYISGCQYQAGNYDGARQALVSARNSSATKNVVNTARRNLVFLGFAEEYDEWLPFETEHFSFRFSPRLALFDRVEFAREHEAAYETISTWFGGGPDRKIRFFVWMDNAEAQAMGLPPLGFARPPYHLIHAYEKQTVGHEMTHIISDYAVASEFKCGLINEGTSIYHDQTGRDTLDRARTAMAAYPAEAPAVSLAALWEDWSLLEDTYSYPVAGAWITWLIEKGGREKFLTFFPNQSLANARAVYGPDLSDWMTAFETALAGD